jgi:hypothetical protein
MSNDPSGPSQAVRERVQWPALFLVAGGTLNLLVGLLQATRVVVVAVTPAEDAYRAEVKWWDEWAQRSASHLVASQAAAVRKARPEERKRQQLFSDVVLALVLLVPAVLAVGGGVGMYRLRSWPLAVVGALAAAAPGLSPVSCCCLGEVVGIWCVVVLLRPEVREAFR